jgi:aspartate-semialdehyde dehydrogenase
MKVGVLGATGMVGQKIIHLLHNHPLFELTEITASERSVGRSFSEGCRYMAHPLPAEILSMEIKDAEDDLDCDLVFSALPAHAAGKIEKSLAEKGMIIASNASAHRMNDDVPLVIPEVNPDHLVLLETQKCDGGIVTNPNCATIQLVLALKPLHDAFTVTKISAVSLQALSGAGYPGVASFEIIDNVVPYIADEEEKLETEPLKILGTVRENGVRSAEIQISASCNRVNVSDGHLECVAIQLQEKPDLDTVKETMRVFTGLPQKLSLPSAPIHPLHLTEDSARPQPRLDREKEGGMACTVGRVREDSVLDFKFLVLGHNTVRGAAGASILNGELLHAEGYL